MVTALLVLLLQALAPALENDYVRVSRDSAPCASAGAPDCAGGDRVIVALSNIELRYGSGRRSSRHTLKRGEIAVFPAGKSYEPPKGGSFFEVSIKPNHPAVASPGKIIPPEK